MFSLGRNKVKYKDRLLPSKVLFFIQVNWKMYRNDARV